MPKPPLTRREREIMDILHRLRRATAHEVQDNLADPPSYSAVRTHLRLLEERGHVRHVEEGQRYCTRISFSCLVARATFTR